MSHIHGEILPTPDSKANSDHYTGNIKPVGKLVGELERLKLRDNTVLAFIGDNGTVGAPRRCPRIWLIRIDFFPPFADLADAKLPAKTVIDGHGKLPQIQGKKGQPRDWIYIQLARQWYFRDSGWKLKQAGELFDMSPAPSEELMVARDTKKGAASAGTPPERKRSKKVSAALRGLKRPQQISLKRRLFGRTILPPGADQQVMDLRVGDNRSSQPQCSFAFSHGSGSVALFQ